MKMLYLDLFRSNLRMFSFFLNEKPRFKISVNRKNLKSANLRRIRTKRSDHAAQAKVRRLHIVQNGNARVSVLKWVVVPRPMGKRGRGSQRLITIFPFSYRESLGERVNRRQ